MIIKNITSGINREILVLTSLKNDREEEDLSIQPGEYIDTEEYCIPDRKVETNNELKKLQKPTPDFPKGKIKIMKSLEEDDRDAKLLKEESLNEQRKQVLDRIAGTNGLSELEDYITNSKDPQVVRAAKDRMIELTGNEGTDNSETKDRNPLL